MCGLWNATSESTIRPPMPSARHRSLTSWIAGTSPESTADVVAAATATARSVRPASRRSASSGGSATMTMPPLPATSRSSTERRQTSRAPCSRVSTPAVTAAAISPTEWPITASGCTPAARQVAASATCIAKIIGWITSTGCSASLAIAARSETPSSSVKIGSRVSITPANTGSPAASPRPIPTHCEPCPENTHTRPAPVAGVLGSTPCPASSPSWLISSTRLAANTAARCGRCARRRASVCPTSAVETVRLLVSQPTSRSAYCRRAAGLAADSGYRPGRPSTVEEPVVGRSSAVSACSRTTCAMVPP